MCCGALGSGRETMLSSLKPASGLSARMSAVRKPGSVHRNYPLIAEKNRNCRHRTRRALTHKYRTSCLCLPPPNSGWQLVGKFQASLFEE